MNTDATTILAEKPVTPTLKEIEQVEAEHLRLDQVALPLKHQFAPGVYFREIFMPAGVFVIGHQHKTEHFNVVLSGKANVLCDGEVMEIVAPMVFSSKAGVRKMLHIIEDMRWATIHPTNETDVEKLEEILVEKSEAFLCHKAEMQKLLEHA